MGNPNQEGLVLVTFSLSCFTFSCFTHYTVVNDFLLYTKYAVQL